MPSGCKLIFLGFLSFDKNHSSADMVGNHVTRVGGKRSSWKSSLYKIKNKIIYRFNTILN